MDPVIGIDLGTTNSVVAYTDPNGTTTTIAGHSGSRIVPSCVYFPTSDEAIVGEGARQYAVVKPDRVAQLFKRGMGEQTFLESGEPFVVDGRTWTPVELSAMVLKALTQMAEHHLDHQVSRAVITVPAYFGEPERAATKAAGELIGLEVLRIINEPTAAALSHGLEQEVQGRVLVFDLGGGTFDVTIMELREDRPSRVIAIGGNRRLGGIDFDRRILGRMVEQANRETGTDPRDEPWSFRNALDMAEQIKRELSRATQSERPVTTGGRPVMFELSRTELEELLADKRQEIEDTIITTMEKAGVSAGDLADVLMVGGSSRMPVFQELLQGLTGRAPRLSRNLDEDVARGAAILATKLGDELEPDPKKRLWALPVPVDVASHGLGTTSWRDVNGQAVPDYNAILIPAGTPLPAQGETTLRMLFEASSVRVNLNEGDDTDLDYVRQLGETRGDFEQRVPKGHPVRFTIAYTTDQLIQVKAYDGVSGRFLCELNIHHEHDGLLTDSAREEARSYLKDLDLDR